MTQEYRIPTTGEHWRKRAKLTGAAEARRRRRIGEYRIKKSRTDRTDLDESKLVSCSGSVRRLGSIRQGDEAI